MENRVDHVIVRRTGADGEEVVNNLDTRFELTPSIDHILNSPKDRRQLDLSKLDFDTPNQRKEEDDDSNGGNGTPPPVRYNIRQDLRKIR
jgi:hypothetical protein